ncbi:MAG: MBL fold metallo-hydrolase [Actinomycetota bacterium]|nr:MBL fold metallo-hydrolase [Acidimicrobiia bacterium]MDQ3468395.1 MBL fold metallo-hydrolase [Actinomycetota bacterium]
MITFPDPLRVADATFLIRPLVRAPGATAGLHVNSMVILGAQPMIVDTGPALGREAWCEQVFGLVDPDDVRWVFVSHDDVDHTGNLQVVLDECPQARLVTSLLDGDRFPIGDRELRLLRPPVFDCPATRGLFDPVTGVYWAADAFGCAVTEFVDHAGELPPEAWAEGMSELALSVSPWLSVADPTRFGRWVDRVSGLDPSIVVGAHGPVLCGSTVDAAVSRLRQLPGSPEAPASGHDLFQETLALLQPV